MPEGTLPRRRAWAFLAWALTLAVLALYVSLPDGIDASRVISDGDTAARPSDLEVVEVSPPAAAPGEAVAVRVVGATDPAKLKAFAGKQELRVLARRDDTLVVELPTDRTARRVKIRVADERERSKPYDIQLEPPNLKKSFRNLAGGLALLVFGISLFARGAREALGPASARLLQRVGARTPTALVAGIVLGALAQSTTAAAGFLSALVAGDLLAVSSAAAAFIGSGLGAATAPVVTGFVEAREGLLVVAIGVIWMSVASDRRASALGRVVLGAGLLTFGLHLLRQGFEPFVSNPALLPIVDQLRADSLVGIVLCVLLGVLLVAALQGPAPVLVLVLGFAETTGHWDLRTCLAVLSGTGFGTALAALVTTRAGPRSRDLVKLELLLGAAMTLFVALTLGPWASLAERLLAGESNEMSWGRRVLLPNLGPHVGLAFALSHLAAAIVLLPLVSRVASAVEHVSRARAESKLARTGDPRGVVRAALLAAIRHMTDALESTVELCRRSSRVEGRRAEFRLADARTDLTGALGVPMRAMQRSSEADQLGAALLACLQLRRALEVLLLHAERFVDDRIAVASFGERSLVREDDERLLERMHAALRGSLLALSKSLATHVPVDIEAARANEIIMNGLDASARAALLERGRDAEPLGVEVRLLDLVDAYEASGNQAYRLAETLSEIYAPSVLVEAI